MTGALRRASRLARARRQHTKQAAVVALAEAPTAASAQRPDEAEQADCGPQSADALRSGTRRALVLDVSFKPVVRNTRVAPADLRLPLTLMFVVICPSHQDIVNWKRAICLDLFDKVDVLVRAYFLFFHPSYMFQIEATLHSTLVQEYYNDFVRTPSDIFPLPAVLKIHYYRRNRSRRTRISVSRTDVFARDNFECQYCGCSNPPQLSVDHIIPSSRGGPWTWENLATACQRCNTKKGARTPAEANMQLRSEPKEPTLTEFGGQLTPGFPTLLYNPPSEVRIAFMQLFVVFVRAARLPLKF
jgi:hypothetical protein